MPAPAEKAKYSKILNEIIKKFKTDRDLVKFGNGIEKLAYEINTNPMYFYMSVANFLNLKANNGKFYECEEAKSGKADCGECRHLMIGADSCIEDSVITPVCRIINPDYEPAHFEKVEKESSIVMGSPYFLFKQKKNMKTKSS